MGKRNHSFCQAEANLLIHWSHTWVSFYAHPQQQVSVHCKGICSLLKGISSQFKYVPHDGDECRSLSLRPGPWGRQLELDPLHAFITHGVTPGKNNPWLAEWTYFLWLIIYYTMLSDEVLWKKICFPGGGKSDRLVEKELTVFVPVVFFLLKLLGFSLLITKACCLWRKQKHKTNKIVMKNSFVGQWSKCFLLQRKPCLVCK